MTRAYVSNENAPEGLTLQGAKRLRHKILAYWHSRGETRVEVNIQKYDTPKEHYAVRSNIVSLGLLGKGVY
jgi:hypothetical protein